MRGKEKRSYVVRHFTSFLVLTAALGIIILYIGSLVDSAPVASFGSAIFSAATVGAIFKIISYDIYLKEILTEFLTDSGFLRMLREGELRQHIKKSISEIRDITPSEDIYRAVEKNLIDELGKVVAHNRDFNIVISQSGYGRNILRSITTYSATLINESHKTLPLFQDFVCEIKTTPPRTMSLRDIPTEARDVSNFVGLHVNDQPVSPDKDEIDWVDSSDKSKGVYGIVIYNAELKPQTPTMITYTINSLIDDSDYIIRRFKDFTRNASLTIQHPKGFEVTVVWFRTPDVKIHEPSVGPTFYSQKTEGVYFPGGGFIAILKRRSTG